MNIEKLFSENKYNGRDVLPFRIISGKGNTMISTPHSVNQVKSGDPKVADMHTGSIGANVSLATGCHLIMKTSNQGDNANGDSSCEYKDALLKYVKENNIKYLIDIHGMKDSYKIDIDIGIDEYKNVKNDIELIGFIKNYFSLEFSKTTIDEIFTAKNEGTVSKFISNNSDVKCVQLELSKRLRNEGEIIKVLSHLVDELNNRYL